MIFVPSATDANTFFEEKSTEDDAAESDSKVRELKAVDSSGKSVNLHRDFYEMADDLYVVGLGGTVPAYYQSFDSMGFEYEDEPYMQEVASFPYEDDEAYELDLTDVFAKKLFHAFDEKDKDKNADEVTKR